MADKMYTIAGVSTLNDVVTFRFATGKAKVRAGVLKRNGHTDIDLRDLPNEMTKADAQSFLEAQGITAVVPVSGRKAAVVQTPEEIEAARVAAEKEAKNAERRAARAAKKAAEVAEADGDFIAGITGDETGDGSAEALIDAPANVEVVEPGFAVDVPAMLEQDEPTTESILESLDEAGV